MSQQQLGIEGVAGLGSAQAVDSLGQKRADREIASHSP